VKLIDQYPGSGDAELEAMRGYQLMIAMRRSSGAAIWTSFDKPRSDPCGLGDASTQLSLHDVDHVFLKAGHTVMVEVQSTWFPLYDRNPQTFVPNIFEAKESDYQKATQRIYRTKEYPSRVEIGVVPEGAGK
jgi:uncharacterized protein